MQQIQLIGLHLVVVQVVLQEQHTEQVEQEVLDNTLVLEVAILVHQEALVPVAAEAEHPQSCLTQPLS